MIKFKVTDSEGNDVTTSRNWYINSDGELFFETEDIDSPLMEADGFSYEITETITLRQVENIISNHYEKLYSESWDALSDDEKAEFYNQVYGLVVGNKTII